MKTRYITGLAVLAVALAAFGSSAWAEDNPDLMPWRTDVEQAFKDAKEKGMPLIVEFSCDWGSG